MADHPLRPATDRGLGEPLPHQQANPASAAPTARGPFGSPAFLLRAHAVLIRLSPGYPPLQDTFRCSTHPFATRRQAEARVTVRLACVKHAASVQSEPGSNSSVQSIFALYYFKGRSYSKYSFNKNPFSYEHFVSMLVTLTRLFNSFSQASYPSSSFKLIFGPSIQNQIPGSDTRIQHKAPTRFDCPCF